MNLQTIRARVLEDDHDDAVEHAEEMYELVSEARLAAVRVPGAKGERIVQDLNDLQLAIDELKDVVGGRTEHDEIEHALEHLEHVLCPAHRPGGDERMKRLATKGALASVSKSVAPHRQRTAEVLDCWLPGNPGGCRL